MIVELELKDLEIPQGLLPRVLTGTVEEKVEEYAELLEEGVEFNPILVWEREDGHYWVIDGVHRVSAYRKAGKERIKAKLVKCKDELDYRIRAIQANLKHGLALAKGERALLAQTLYRQAMGEEEIRKVFGVSQETVRKWLAPIKQEEKEAKIRRAVELREKGWKVKDIAKELGVDERTIYRYLEEPDKMVNITNLTLLTPEGTPTPEGLRHFSDFVLKCYGDWHLRNDDILLHQLKEKGYEVEYEEVREFHRAVMEAILSLIRRLAGAGLSPAQIRASIVHEKEGIFEHLSTSVKKRLSTLLEGFINEVAQGEKLSPSPNPPSNSPLAGTPPALFNGTEEEQGEVEEIEPGIPLHRPIPPKEKLYEMAYGGEEEEKKEVRRPPSRYDELEKTIAQMDACVKWIYAHFGKEKALSVLQQFYDEISALPESELAKLEGNL